MQLEDHQNIDAIVDLIRARGLNLRHLVEKRQTLEDLFLATHAADARTEDAAVRQTKNTKTLLRNAGHEVFRHIERFAA